jgi:hypothetical protein
MKILRIISSIIREDRQRGTIDQEIAHPKKLPLKAQIGRNQ